MKTKKEILAEMNTMNEQANFNDIVAISCSPEDAQKHARKSYQLRAQIQILQWVIQPKKRKS